MSDDASQDKTEQPTPRKLEKSREKGQIAYSADLTAGASLLITTMAFAIFGDSLIQTVTNVVRELLAGFQLASTDDYQWREALVNATWQVCLACLPLMGVAFFSTLLFGGLLTGGGLSLKALNADLGKLNPVKGFSKLFSLRSVIRGLMSVLKLGLISTIVGIIIWQQFGIQGIGQSQSMDQTIENLIDLVTLLLLGVASGLVMLGIADFGFQKWKHLEEMKMSRQELMDERKDDEGDPHTRARMKRVQREISQRSLVQDVLSSTVVITNPTHFAVCLKYDSSLSAPIVVAKGHDAIALRIIKIAKDNKVAVVERKPLARALFYTVESGQEIPLELYQTVAEVLTFIRSIDRQFG